MRILNSVVASSALACLASVAHADSGLRVGPISAPGAQSSWELHAVRVDGTPLRLGNPSPGGWPESPALAASLGGDYYFSTAIADPTLPRTGFRASSALFIRQPGVSLADVAWSSRSAASFGVPLHLTLPSVAPGLADPAAYGVTSMPYLGIGYNDFSLKSGWGFWADVGLVVQSPGNSLGLGRVLSGTQGVDDLMRELRLAPLLQLGVNYAF